MLQPRISASSQMPLQLASWAAFAAAHAQARPARFRHNRRRPQECRHRRTHRTRRASLQTRPVVFGGFELVVAGFHVRAAGDRCLHGQHHVVDRCTGRSQDRTADAVNVPSMEILYTPKRLGVCPECLRTVLTGPEEDVGVGVVATVVRHKGTSPSRQRGTAPTSRCP